MAAAILKAQVFIHINCWACLFKPSSVVLDWGKLWIQVIQRLYKPPGNWTAGFPKTPVSFSSMKYEIFVAHRSRYCGPSSNSPVAQHSLFLSWRDKSVVAPLVVFSHTRTHEVVRFSPGLRFHFCKVSLCVWSYDHNSPPPLLVCIKTEFSVRGGGGVELRRTNPTNTGRRAGIFLSMFFFSSHPSVSLYVMRGGVREGQSRCPPSHSVSSVFISQHWHSSVGFSAKL